MKNRGELVDLSYFDVEISGAEVGYFEGRGCVAELGHKDIRFPNETVRAVDGKVGS